MTCRQLTTSWHLITSLFPRPSFFQIFASCRIIALGLAAVEGDTPLSPCSRPPLHRLSPQPPPPSPPPPAISVTTADTHGTGQKGNSFSSAGRYHRVLNTHARTFLPLSPSVKRESPPPAFYHSAQSNTGSIQVRRRPLALLATDSVVHSSAGDPGRTRKAYSHFFPRHHHRSDYRGSAGVLHCHEHSWAASAGARG